MSPYENIDTDHPLICVERPFAQSAEELRSLRNTLALRWFRNPDGAKTLTVVGVNGLESSALMAANLAIAFAQADFKTLVIDADLRTAPLQKILGATGRSSLADYLAGPVPTAAAALNTQAEHDKALANDLSGELFQPVSTVPNLSFLPAGTPVPNPQELLLRGLLAPLLARAAEQYDVILINTAPAHDASDYLLVAAATGGILMVTVAGETPVHEARKLIQSCRELDIRVVGSTMVE